MKKRSGPKTKLSGASSQKRSVSDLHLSEPELTYWAEQSTMASSGNSRSSGLGALIFWLVIAAILVARFFFIDPAKLRPSDKTSPSFISSESSPKS